MSPRLGPARPAQGPAACARAAQAPTAGAWPAAGDSGRAPRRPRQGLARGKEQRPPAAGACRLRTGGKGLGAAALGQSTQR